MDLRYRPGKQQRDNGEGYTPDKSGRPNRDDREKKR